MCAIVGSFDRDKLIELIELNSYRGSHSYSFSTIEPYIGRLGIHKKEIGSVNYDDIKIPRGHYAIVHVQAPTTEARSVESVHPATALWLNSFRHDKYNETNYYSRCLWHNGIIKEDCVKQLQKKYSTDEKWDTALLLKEVGNSFDNLSSVDGSFSCLYYNNPTLYIFRNEISPLFVDGEMNMSSTMFQGSEATEPNVVYEFWFNTKEFKPRAKFKTVENPYFFADELHI